MTDRSEDKIRSAVGTLTALAGIGGFLVVMGAELAWGLPGTLIATGALMLAFAVAGIWAVDR